MGQEKELKENCKEAKRKGRHHMNSNVKTRSDDLIHFTKLGTKFRTCEDLIISSKSAYVFS